MAKQRMTREQYRAIYNSQLVKILRGRKKDRIGLVLNYWNKQEIDVQVDGITVYLGIGDIKLLNEENFEAETC